VISPDWLIEDGLLQASDCQSLLSRNTKLTTTRVIPFKHQLLETAWAHFKAGARSDLPPGI
jgi:hypothetical protein